MILLTSFGWYFHRLPKEYPPEINSYILPSFGKVKEINTLENGVEYIQFLNIFDKHGQYAPCDGIVIDQKYKPGTFNAANFLTKSKFNERNEITIQCDDGNILTVKQIAGLLARRISTLVEVGDRVTKGQLIGFIHFGSRVDLTITYSHEYSDSSDSSSRAQ